MFNLVIYMCDKLQSWTLATASQNVELNQPDYLQLKQGKCIKTLCQTINHHLVSCKGPGLNQYTCLPFTSVLKITAMFISNYRQRGCVW